jgi:hypothetical protein
LAAAVAQPEPVAPEAPAKAPEVSSETKAVEEKKEAGPPVAATEEPKIEPLAAVPVQALTNAEAPTEAPKPELPPAPIVIEKPLILNEPPKDAPITVTGGEQSNPIPGSNPVRDPPSNPADVNGEVKDVEMTEAPKASEPDKEKEPEKEVAEVGDKRKAEEPAATNGGDVIGKEKKKPAKEPIGKRVKLAVESVVEKLKPKSTNGTALAEPAAGPLSRKGSKGKREKPAVPAVGRTERRTRSQGLAE